MNEGLLYGLSEGLSSGVDAYLKSRQMADERRARAEEAAMRKKAYQLQLQQAGLSETPEGFERTPEGLEKERRSGLMEEAKLMGGYLKPVKQDDKLMGFERDIEAMKAKAESDPYAQMLKRLDVEKKTAELPYATLPKEKQEMVSELGKKVATGESIAKDLEANLAKLDDPKLSNEQKLVHGQNMLKLVNSATTAAPDVVGAEEANRIGALLKYHFANFTQPGPIVGRAPISEFANQVRNLIDALKSSTQSKKGLIEESYGRPQKAVAEPQAAQTRVIDGVTYQKVPGGWNRVKVVK